MLCRYPQTSQFLLSTPTRHVGVPCRTLAKWAHVGHLPSEFEVVQESRVCRGLEDCLRCRIPPASLYAQHNPCQNQGHSYFAEILELILKFIEKHEGPPNNAKTVLRIKNPAGGLMLQVSNLVAKL